MGRRDRRGKREGAEFENNIDREYKKKPDSEIFFIGIPKLVPEELFGEVSPIEVFSHSYPYPLLSPTLLPIFFHLHFHSRFSSPRQRRVPGLQTRMRDIKQRDGRFSHGPQGGEF